MGLPAIGIFCCDIGVCAELLASWLLKSLLTEVDIGRIGACSGKDGGFGAEDVDVCCEVTGSDCKLPVIDSDDELAVELPNVVTVLDSCVEECGAVTLGLLLADATVPGMSVEFGVIAGGGAAIGPGDGVDGGSSISGRGGRNAVGDVLGVVPPLPLPGGIEPVLFDVFTIELLPEVVVVVEVRAAARPPFVDPFRKLRVSVKLLKSGVIAALRPRFPRPFGVRESNSSVAYHRHTHLGGAQSWRVQSNNVPTYVLPRQVTLTTKTPPSVSCQTIPSNVTEVPGSQGPKQSGSVMVPTEVPTQISTISLTVFISPADECFVRLAGGEREVSSAFRFVAEFPQFNFGGLPLGVVPCCIVDE
uniref:Uncharacterized protein n=1 Tax=Glossina pallidipes TaxID=7398 RepID=A0A1A9Z5A9_GLOPL